VQVCAGPMLTKSEKILMSLNSKQKPHYQLATAELFPNDTRKQQKMTKARLGLMPYISGFGLCNHTKPYFLA